MIAEDLPLQSAAPGIGYQPEKFRARLVPPKTQFFLRSIHHIESCGTYMEY